MWAGTLGDVPALSGTSADGWGSLTSWLATQTLEAIRTDTKAERRRLFGGVFRPARPPPPPSVLTFTPANILSHKENTAESFWTDRRTPFWGQTSEMFHSLKPKCCFILCKRMWGWNYPLPFFYIMRITVDERLYGFAPKHKALVGTHQASGEAGRKLQSHQSHQRFPFGSSAEELLYTSRLVLQ